MYRGMSVMHVARIPRARLRAVLLFVLNSMIGVTAGKSKVMFVRTSKRA